MLRDVVNIGDKIEIKQLNQRGEFMKPSKTYVSQMVDFVEEGKISIATPIKKGITVPLEKGANYRLYFYTIKGLYQCDSKMIHTYRENNMLLALMEPSYNIKKIQRRQYYRLECVHEMEYRYITEEEINLQEKLIDGKKLDSTEEIEISDKLANLKKIWSKAIITDLSGGGCRFNSEHVLKSGDRIMIKLDFIVKNELKKLKIIAEIIASQRMLDRVGVYEHRAEYIDISRKDREDLIKYIFEEERRLRKNEKK